MSYVVSVGGDPINPNPFTYSQISMTGNVTLVWPANTQDATYTATDWIDITSSAAYIVTMPAATEVGTGAEVVFYNYGSYTITVNDSIGGNITTVTSGSTIRIWITDNSTDAGTWRIANIGSGTTSANASMLAGYGLIAQAGQLSQSMPPLSYSTSATLNAGNRAGLADWTGGVGTFTLTNPSTLGSNWFVNVKNSGTGILTLNGNGATIDGSSTLQVDIQQGFTLATDGVTFYTIGRPILTTPAITQLSKSVAGSSDVTLTATEAAYSIINFTGALTGAINVIVPANVNEWLMYNNTTGAYTLTVKTASGSGVAITQGTRRLLYCDGTNVNFSDSVGTGTVTSVATGTGLSGGPITGSGTISLANTAVTAGTYGSASRSVTYTVNAQGQITSSTDSPIDVSGLIGTLGVAHGGTSLATLTANNVILGNGTSAPQFVAPSTSGNVLTSNGTTWTSSPLSPAASGLTLLATVNASAAASVTFNSTYITNSYNKYVIEFDGVFTAGGGDDLYLTASVNNGSGYLSTGYYASGLKSANGTLLGRYDNNTGQLNITGGTAALGAAITNPTSGTLKLSTPSASAPTNVEMVANLMSTAGGLFYYRASGIIPGNTAINNLKIVSSDASNITGNFHLYGLAGT